MEEESLKVRYGNKDRCFSIDRNRYCFETFFTLVWTSALFDSSQHFIKWWANANSQYLYLENVSAIPVCMTEIKAECMYILALCLHI